MKKLSLRIAYFSYKLNIHLHEALSISTVDTKITLWSNKYDSTVAHHSLTFLPTLADDGRDVHMILLLRTRLIVHEEVFFLLLRTRLIVHEEVVTTNSILFLQVKYSPARSSIDLNGRYKKYTLVK